MAFTNLAKKLILNGRDTHGPGPDTSPMGNGYIFLKYAWSIKISDDGLDSAPPLVAKTCELPRWTAETQIVNAYNHKTIVQTKLTYEPITMSFYDQVNGTAERLIWKYVQAQFDDTDGSKKPDFTPLTIEISMKDLSGEGTGDKVYTLTDAFIVDAQHDTLDYSTSDVVLWTISVRYENLKISGVKDLEFDGPTPKEKTGIAPLPKPPKPPKPITKPPKKDALKEIERGGRSSEFAKTDPRRLDLSNWEKAGGGVTGGGAAFGNPNLTKQAARARASAQKSPSTMAWPVGSSKQALTNNPAASAAQKKEWAEQDAEQAYYDDLKARGVSGRDDALQKARTTASTGTPTPATSNKQPENRKQTAEEIKRQKDLTVANKEFVKQEAANVKDDRGMNPEYKKAYLEGLEKYPPRSKSLQSQESSRQQAELQALAKSPRYSSQTRNVDNGVIVNSQNLQKREPSPPPVREGATQINPKANDTVAPAILATQAKREGNYKTTNYTVRQNNDPSDPVVSAEINARQAATRAEMAKPGYVPPPPSKGNF